MRRRLRILLLPLGLLVLSGGLLGTYFETNDDLAIVALLRGETAAAPVTDLYLYFHGYAAVWSWLYAASPTVPWYGLTLYALLYAATVLLAAVLWRVLQPRLGTWSTLALLLLLWFVGWLEHSLWFNYMRVPLLLAGAGGLFAARPTNGPKARWALAVGLLAFGLSWLIRPSAAVLGLGAALPGMWWLAGRRLAPLVAGAAAWTVLGAVWLYLVWSPQAVAFRRLDVLKSNLNDFQLAAPPPRPLPPADSLALDAARAWQLADSTLINEASLRRVAPFRAGYFLRHTVPAKLALLAQQLPRNYFPLLLLLAATAGLVLRAAGQRQHRAFWLVQLGYGLALLALGTVLKLPPRLALPLLNFWALSNLLYLGQLRPLPPRTRAVLLLALLATAGPYAYKSWHRSTTLAQEQVRNRATRQRLYTLAAPVAGSAPALLVTDALEETYKSENPFAPAPGPAGAPRRLSVKGWPTLHPSQAALRQQLTGTRDFTEALRRLGPRAEVAWVFTPEGAALLNRQLRAKVRPGQPVCQLRRAPGQDSTLKNNMHAYYMRAKFP
ncbi:hypothetical protein J7E24_17375 [Hymenobacter sp. ISL-91]|uniref:hypothetical protein n=1 Tax=Hymenobacter sp. ISL-91 TaxID=2819151 RepID=UPI001BE99D4A|nr:hypothetical protein [Hymenobacter sp. ISL-91]MBT2559557.1 hypothetical protein [Hymenobacter sp. ISL-91]